MLFVDDQSLPPLSLLELAPPAQETVSHETLEYTSRLIERKLIMGIADGTVSVDGKVIYTAKSLKVGLFLPNETIG